MDRQISPEEIRRSRIRRALKFCIPALAVITILIFVIANAGDSVGRKELQTARADRGAVEASVNASGKVVPAFEEIITSPIAARIVEVYCHAGDSVAQGTPLLRLDLQATETAVNNERDARRKQEYAIRQQELNNRTRLSNLEMEIKVKEMSTRQLRAEVDNERRLDSIGSGTGDRVREAELAYNTACIQLDQLRRQLHNEQLALDAELESRRIDLSIFDKNLTEQLRTLENARLKAPRAATLTYINTEVGRQVAAGERLAVIADLSNFRIDAEIAESNGRYLAAGGDAVVRISKNDYHGKITNVAPTSSSGVVKFSVILDQDNAPQLRPGLSAEIFVMRDLRPDVVRIPMGSYYSQGPGNYDLFVETSHGTIERRKVVLGNAGYDYVEVVSGIDPGETVVISDLSRLKGSRYDIKENKR